MYLELHTTFQASKNRVFTLGTQGHILQVTMMLCIPLFAKHQIHKVSQESSRARCEC